ncbi:MAG: hypothetical protein A2V79_10835 [Betaproteobacteria bacterium RBG_16_56_24]|nr:MAG: hypothetical protein A2V79_10835 [Betaproteobacteria bacterium RBG_16_56_24]
MKTIYLALISLGAAMLVAGCGGGSSGAASSTTTASGKVTLTSVNAPDVAKGGMTTSQTTAKTGLGGASVVGVEVQPGAPRKSVMDIALAQFRRVKALKLPAAPDGVVGVSIAPFPIIFGCGAYAGTSDPAIPGFTTTLNSTSGTMTIDLVDTNLDVTFNNGDVASITFASCVESNPVAGTTTMNGGFSLTINSQTGGVLNANTDMMEGTAGSPLVESVAMSFTNFTIVDTAPAETMTMNGGMTLSVTDNGTLLTATMSGTSFAMTSSTDGNFTMKNFSIAATGDSPSATLLTDDYSFSVTMTTNIADLGGDVDITTPTPFTGTGDYNPTAGVMLITGANGGTLTLTAQANGSAVAMVLDTDGASGSTAPQTLTSTTWDAI